MKNNKYLVLVVLLLATLNFAQAQSSLKIGNNSTIINTSAVLELQSTTKGFLPPRMSSAERNSIVSPPVGLTIYNSTFNCLEWYNGTSWTNPCAILLNTNGSGNVSNYSCTTNSSGTMTAGIEVSGVTQTITATVTKVGTYNISAFSNGVTFAASGTFVGLGAQNIVLTATGTPTATGSNTFVLNTTPNCSFARTIVANTSSNGTAVISAITCNTASAGTMTEGIAVSGVTQTITATVTTVGSYNFSTTANGVTFAASGTFSGTGNQNIVLTASGTPTNTGSFNYSLNSTSSCSFVKFVQTEIVEITSTTGKIWMDRNLGATRVAQSKDDYLAFGHLYQWGRGNDGHAEITWTNATTGTAANGTTTTLSTTDSPGNNLFIIATGDWRATQNDNLWQGAAGINNPCPAGYRVPTLAELSAEFTAYNITNCASAFASPLKFANSGYRDYSDGSVIAGDNGSYWTNSVSTLYANFLFYDDSSTQVLEEVRSLPLAVRCIKD